MQGLGAALALALPEDETPSGLGDVTVQTITS